MKNTLNEILDFIKRNFETLVSLVSLFFIIVTFCWLLGWSFNANIWGTGSDWVMVNVTALTAILLYKTLKSQTDVQNIQQKGLKLELEKARKEMAPIFTVNILEVQNGSEGTLKLPFSLICTENVSKNVAINFKVI